MSFAANSIGFLLDLDDQMSPTLVKAGTNYERFVKELDKWNQKAFRSVNKGFAALSQLVDSFTGLPKKAGAVYQSFRKELSGRMKPLTQRVNLEFSPRSSKEVGRAISAVVAKSLGKMTLRMSAVMPKRKNALFDDSVALRKLYNTLPQPPDMKGVFQGIPRYAQGGVVPNTPNTSAPKPDNVLSLLSPGEMVVPVKATDIFLKAMALLGRNKKGQFTTGHQAVPKKLLDLLGNIQLQHRGLNKAKTLVDSGLNPKAESLYIQGLKDLEKMTEEARKQTQGLSLDLQGALSGAFAAVGKRSQTFLGDLKAVAKQDDSLSNSGFKWLRFLGVSKAMTIVGDQIKKMYGGAKELFNTMGGEQIDDFVTNMNKTNKLLGLSRSELTAEKEAFASLAQQMNISLTGMGEANESLAQAGVISKKLRMELAPVVSVMAEATNASIDGVAKLTYELVSLGKLSKTQVADLYADFAKQATMFDGAMNPEAAIEQAQKNFHDLGAFMVNASGETQNAVMKNLAAAGNAFAQQFAGQGGAIEGLLTKAASGTVEGQQTAGMLFGRTSMEVQEMLKSAEGTKSLIQSFGSIFARAGADPALQALLKDTLNVQDFSEQAIGVISGNLPKITGAFTDMTNAAFKNGEGMAYLQKRMESNRTTFQNFSVWLTNSIANMHLFGISGVDVLNFFHEFNPVATYSAVMLGKELYPVLGKVGSAFMSLGSGALGVTKSVITGFLPAIVSAVEMMGSFAVAIGKGAAGLVTDFAGSLGAIGIGLRNMVGSLIETVAGWFGYGAAAQAASVANLEVAATSTVAGAGVAEAGVASAGAGAGFAAFLTSVGIGLRNLASGLVALTPAIPVMLVLGAVFSGAVIAIGYAINLITPALAVLGDVMKTAIGGLVEIFKTLGNMSAGQLLAVVPALVLLGPAFAAMGAGVLAGSVALALASVPLAIFAGVMKLMGAGVSGSSGIVAAAIDSIAATFVVDQARLQAASDGVALAAKFMVGFSLLAVAMTAAGILSAGMVGGGLIGKLVYGITAFFLGDPMQNLKSSAKDIAQTINSLSADFGQTIKADGLPQAVTNIEASGKFMEAYGKIEGAIRGAAPTGGFFGAIKTFFVGKDTEELAKHGGEIVSVVNSLVKSFAGANWDAQLPRVAEQLKPVGEFMKSVGDITSGASKLAEFQGKGGVVGALGYMLAGTEPKQAVKAVDGLNDVIVAISTVLGPTLKAQESNLLSMQGGMTALGPVFNATAGLVDPAKKMASFEGTGGFFGWVAGIFVGDNPSQAIQAVYDLSRLVYALATSFSAGTFGPSGVKGLADTTAGLTETAKAMAALGDVVKAMPNVVAFTAIDASKLSAVGPMLAKVSDSFSGVKFDLAGLTAIRDAIVLLTDLYAKMKAFAESPSGVGLAFGMAVDTLAIGIATAALKFSTAMLDVPDAFGKQLDAAKSLVDGVVTMQQQMQQLTPPTPPAPVQPESGGSRRGGNRPPAPTWVMPAEPLTAGALAPPPPPKTQMPYVREAEGYWNDGTGLYGRPELPNNVQGEETRPPTQSNLLPYIREAEGFWEDGTGSYNRQLPNSVQGASAQEMSQVLSAISSLPNLLMPAPQQDKAVPPPRTPAPDPAMGWGHVTTEAEWAAFKAAREPQPQLAAPPPPAVLPTLTVPQLVLPAMPPPTIPAVPEFKLATLLEPDWSWKNQAAPPQVPVLPPLVVPAPPSLAPTDWRGQIGDWTPKLNLDADPLVDLVSDRINPSMLSPVSDLQRLPMPFADVPPVTTSQTDAATRIFVEGNVTASDAATHELLRELIRAVQGQEDLVPQASSPNSPRGVSDTTAHLAGAYL